MSGVWGLFGGTQKKGDARATIINLREHLSMLQKREKNLQSQIDEHYATARRNVATNKAAAKKALERKKLCEGQRDQTEGHINTLQQQIYAIEAANINRETLRAMEQASTAMQQIHGNLTPEKVDETMEKLREQNALGDEIAGAMTSTDLAGQVDSDDLEAELDELAQESVDEELLKMDRVAMPSSAQGQSVGVSQSKNAESELDEETEAEFRQLQAEMA